MKTHREIVLAAQRLDERGRQFADEQRRATADRFDPKEAFAILFGFPDSRFTSHAGGEADEMHTHLLSRRVEVAMVGDALEYRLLQDEVETTATGEVVREIGPVLLVSSDSALEVLEEGYELEEEERLSELLAPVMDRIEAGECVESVEPQLVVEIEAIVGADDLLPAARLHAKADIVKLVNGQIEPDDFITAAISRHRHRESICELMAERPTERMLMGQP
jgi:hypothetical protein